MKNKYKSDGLLSGWDPTPKDDKGFWETIDLMIDECMKDGASQYMTFKRRGYTVHIMCGRDIEVERRIKEPKDDKKDKVGE